ncbi:hypothetical protein TIFTF001_024659 [Ficus carica]|uniref:Uncharacterized protein n=1 Tax=Ficus carica TaxID=3494 RepID=A0AA88DGZ4_FICCA|nr:hypothetical protein TIFTF001_024659 [Ficus carica]
MNENPSEPIGACLAAENGGFGDPKEKAKSETRDCLNNLVNDVEDFLDDYVERNQDDFDEFTDVDELNSS